MSLQLERASTNCMAARRGILPLANESNFSTPTARGQFVAFCPPSPTGSVDQEKSFRFFDVNRRPLFRIDDTEIPASNDFSLTAEQLNEHHPRPSHWKEKPLSTYKFVDDFLSCEKSWLGNSYKIYGEKKPISVVQAEQCEKFFATVKQNASEIGMRVKDRKTQLLCISPSNAGDYESYIRLGDGSKIVSQHELKQLGFFFSKKPTLDFYLSKIASKFRRQLWFLRHLKKALVSTDDLLHVYKCFLLPIIGYASVVYHPLLTASQANDIERLQSAALKIIYGWEKS